MLGLRHLDVSNLRRRDVWNDHGRVREVPKDREAESNDEFNFASAEEAEGGSAEEFKSGRKGSSQKKEPNPAKHGGDEASKGERPKTSWRQPTRTNSENRSEEAESFRKFDSDTPNQLKAMRRKRQRKTHQHRDNKGAEKGRMSRQADRKG